MCLDLGSGVGRHAPLFAEHGFGVEAIDGAVAGLDFARREAASRGFRLSLRQADADALPFGDESFDYVLSWMSSFRGTMGDVGCRLAEIWRVLKPGGLYQCTMLSKRDAQFGRGPQVAPDTFIRGSDPKAHPHYIIATWPPLPRSSPASSFCRSPGRSSAVLAPGTGTCSPNGGERGRRPLSREKS
jgi:tellurite methyltransferase